MDDIENDPISQFFDDPENVDLYEVLGLVSPSSTSEQPNPPPPPTQEAIKKSYRRLALAYHPDKQHGKSDEERAAMSKKFRQVGFAYTVLSDEATRKVYDETGRTQKGFLEGVGESEGGWEGYFEAIFDKLSRLRLDEDKKQYQGSQEEIDDVRSAYIESSGSLTSILSHIPHTTYSDESRIIAIVTRLIKDKSVESFPTWEFDVKDKKSRDARVKAGRKEEAEAEKLAKELGVWDEFYGSGKPTASKATGKKGKGKGKATKGTAQEEGEEAGEENDEESALKALILKRNEKRKAESSSFLDALAAKYGATAEDDDDEGEELAPSKKKKTSSVAKPKPKAKPAASRGKKRAAEDNDDDDGADEAPAKRAKTTTASATKPAAASTRSKKGKRT